MVIIRIVFSLTILFALVTILFAQVAQSSGIDNVLPVMVSKADDTRQVYLFDPDRRMIVQSLENIQKPLTFSLSHDGHYAAYVSEPGDTADIYTVDLYQGRVQRVTNSVDQEVFTSWSPDGTHLAFASISTDEAQHNIRILNLLDGSSWQLTDNLFGGNTPDWSPDGRYIVFVSGDRRDGANLYVVQAACKLDCAAHQQQVTELLGSELTPSWSPDGEQIAFISIRLGQLGVYLANTNCIYSTENCLLQAPHLLITSSSIKSPLTWSADSRSIIFPQIENGQPELYSLNTACLQMTAECVPQRLTNITRSFLNW